MSAPTEEEEQARHDAKVLEALRMIAEERQAAIENARTILRDAQQHLQEERDRAREIRRNANRALLSAVAAAKDVGLKMNSDICVAIDLSPQALHLMRRSADAWEREAA